MPRTLAREQRIDRRRARRRKPASSWRRGAKPMQRATCSVYGSGSPASACACASSARELGDQPIPTIGLVDLRGDRAVKRRRVLAEPRGGRELLRVDAGLELGRPVVAVDEPRDVLVQPEAEQQVVLGDRVRRRDLPGATDRRDESRGRRHRCIRSGRGARRSPWSRCVVGAAREPRRGGRRGSGRAGGRCDRVRDPALGRASARRTIERPRLPGPARLRSRRRTACAGDRPRRGSSAARPSSASRPRGRRLPPRRRVIGRPRTMPFGLPTISHARW